MVTKILNPDFVRNISAKPIFCFTSDIDWADEEAIAACFSLFDEFEIPLTPFITHKSPYVEKRFSGWMQRVGVHPNFLEGSTHGSDVSEVCRHMQSLNPAAKFYRSHHFYGTSSVADQFRTLGYEFDSNLSLFPQSDIRPLLHSSGLMRYPVFFGDGMWFNQFPDRAVSELIPLLATPGLKIFNFHPIHVALNTPNAAHYKAYRESGKPWQDQVASENGTRTNLIQLLRAVRSLESLGAVYLSDLHKMATTIEGEVTPSKRSVPVSVTTAGDYDAMDEKKRAAFKQGEFSKQAGGGRYATSRDTNMRELEIDFIISSIKAFSSGKPRIVDLGCGNGYTTLRMASEIDAEVTGVDFAESLIADTAELAKELGVKNMPDFRVGDITTLPIPDGSFDVVVTERVLLNMTSVESQRAMLDKIHAMLAPGGLYVMVEGNRDGLAKLNESREALGLVAIPDRGHGNVGSLKFEEDGFQDIIAGKFATLDTRNFGSYFLISRIVQPMLVAPASPSFDHALNRIARDLQKVLPDLFPGSHLMGRVLKKVGSQSRRHPPDDGTEAASRSVRRGA
ncbi:methyltransferase domain-containing protein [Bradyrhizobium sp. Pear77]|uniref:polysaccharide deacetylase WbmS family protein n=1 Tax=Bradyrhizobium altum TaxID=1571202 RepID=UPI0028968645|nr:methyltransferase domain-containing protein [Bradyrhizobium altum]MCC8952087.1 methyltransferase domain-containing protein [Bradyrhizobium altum]